MVLGEKTLKAWKTEILRVKKEFLLKKDQKIAKIMAKKPHKC